MELKYWQFQEYQDPSGTEVKSGQLVTINIRFTYLPGKLKFILGRLRMVGEHPLHYHIFLS